MINPVFTGKVMRGHFVPDDLIRHRNYLCTKEGRVLECIYRIPSKQRSTKENGYYRGVVIPIITEAAGYSGTPDECESIHRALAWKFLKHETILGVEQAISTKDLSTVQFEEYMKNLRAWAYDFFNGCFVPLPNEVEE